MSSNLRPLAVPGALALLAIGVWYLWSNQGDTHNSTLSDTVFGDIAFNPYAWWQSHDGAKQAYVHHYPETVAPQCVTIPFANERGSLSVAQQVGGDELDGQ